VLIPYFKLISYVSFFSSQMKRSIYADFLGAMICGGQLAAAIK
jgi:hypothetical protein